MKKKGLIISTLVMIVVLAASLTTATYAWFSSTATTTVSDIDMTTVAASGLEIGVKTPTGVSASGYVYDAVNYEDGNWTGTDGFGSSIAISEAVAFAGLEDAITSADGTKAYPFKATAVTATFPEGTLIYAEAEKTTLVENGTLTIDTIYHVMYPANTLLVPVDYDYTDSSNPEPTLYALAVANSDYVDLPLAVQAISEGITQIYCTFTVAVLMGETPSTLTPGMAAALRIKIGDTTYKPFEAYTLTPGATQFTAPQDLSAYFGTYSAKGPEMTWTFSVFVQESSAGVDPYAPQDVPIIAWIEGTDDACVTKTAGSGFTMSVDFNFTSGEAVRKTITNGVLV
jgi:hypothetical protein